MKIGIDISQIVHEGTGVSVYVQKLITALLSLDHTNTYVLFGTSLRKYHVLKSFADYVCKHYANITCVLLPIPPTFLDILWNKLHVIPISWFTGPIDVFWSSDWTQPPLGKKIKGITTIHDLSFLHFPEIQAAVGNVENRRLYWAKRECQQFLCDSEATKSDVKKLLNIEADRLSVVYPGLSSIPHS